MMIPFIIGTTIYIISGIKGCEKQHNSMKMLFKISFLASRLLADFWSIYKKKSIVISKAITI